MVSSVAVMAGARHHRSLRSVRSDICARVLAGATDACVIVRRLRPGRLLSWPCVLTPGAPVPRRGAAVNAARWPGLPRWPRVRTKPYALEYHPRDTPGASGRVTLATMR